MADLRSICLPVRGARCLGTRQISPSSPRSHAHASLPPRTDPEILPQCIALHLTRVASTSKKRLIFSRSLGSVNILWDAGCRCHFDQETKKKRSEVTLKAMLNCGCKRYAVTCGVSGLMKLPGFVSEHSSGRHDARHAGPFGRITVKLESACGQ